MKNPRARWIAVLLSMVPIAAASVAAAGPLTLPQGKVNVAVNLEVNLTEDAVGKPTSIAPDLSYGVSDRATLALVHSTVGITGFRGSAGNGLCLSGEDGGCVSPYNNVGLEGRYALVSGTLSATADVGVHALNLDAGFVSAKLGARVRYGEGKVAVTMMPSVLLAVTERSPEPGSPKNKDSLWIPVVATYKVTPEIGVGVATGLKGPVDGFADAWKVSLGVSATYAISPAIGVGGSWIFGQIVGGADDPPEPAPAANGPRYRAVHLWVSYTL